jgi:hypothetical protein
MARLMPLGAVHPIFEIARETGNHLLVQLKANQAKLFDAVCVIADTTTPDDTAIAHNTGRFEIARETGNHL